MDSIAGLEEAVELTFSESIVARDDALAVLSAAAGLGPPDLCWLQKGRGAWSPGADGAAEGSHGYYHHVLGGDVSGSGAIAGRFAELMARVERPGLLAGLWSGPELSVQRGFYCCYDALSRTDLRCELCVPGGVVCGVVDAAGNLHGATDQQLWRQAQVSAFVRAQLYEPEMTLNAGCIVLGDPVPTPAAEAQLLSAVEALYAQGLLPAALEPVSVAQGFGAVPEHCDLALYAVWHHFRRRQRWEAAGAFFSRLAGCYPAAAVWQAAALRASGHAEGALELLGSALERSPSSPPLLAAMAAECMRLQQVDTASRLARRAVNAQPRCRPSWLILARCYAAEGRYAEALVALNAVPTPPLPRDERELLMVVPPPEPERVTVPQARPYQPDLEAARVLALEEGDTGGASRLLAYLPGAVLLNKEPADAGPWPDPSPNRVTRAVLGAVYGQLQEVVGALGWDGFLAVRSSVFVMHDTTRTTSGAVSTPFVDAAAGAQGHAGVNGSREQAAGGPTSIAPGGGDSETMPGQAAAELHQEPQHQHQQQHHQQQQPRPKAHSVGDVGQATIIPGRRSSAGSGGKGEDRPDPAAFYASRLQAMGGSSPAVAKLPATPPPPPPQQQHQHQQQDVRARGGDGHAPFEPMAGRVLLLGRSTRRLGSLREGARQTGRSSSSSSATVQPSSSLASRAGVENLSRLASATAVAALPNHKQPGVEAAQGSNPLLWQAVFGGPAGDASQETLVAPPDSLPRIRTRPLGEAREGWCTAPDAVSKLSTPSSRPQRRLPWQLPRALRRWLHPMASRAPGAVAEGSEGATGRVGQQPQQLLQQQQQQQQEQARSKEQGLLKAGSLLLRTRTSSGTPGSVLAGSVRSVGPIFSVGSGTLSPGGLSGGGAAPQLRSLEADREAIAAGRRLVQPPPGGSQLRRWEHHDGARDPPARLCVRWLDELVVGLWHDLSAYLEWRCLDQSLREARGMTHAEWVLSTRASSGGFGTSSQENPLARASGAGDTAGPKPPVLTASDWARRGFLAERLGHTHNARTAYRVATTLDFSLSAHTALLRLEAQAGALADALSCSQQLLIWHEARAAAMLGVATGTSSGSTALRRPPACVSWFVGECAAGQGAGRVERALEEDASAHPLLQQEVAAWQRQQERDSKAIAAVAAAAAARASAP